MEIEPVMSGSGIADLVGGPKACGDENATEQVRPGHATELLCRGKAVEAQPGIERGMCAYEALSRALRQLSRDRQIGSSSTAGGATGGGVRGAGLHRTPFLQCLTDDPRPPDREHCTDCLESGWVRHPPREGTLD